MKREKDNGSGEPDPHALGIAAAVQEAVAPDTVILFGSRAVGAYREDSDLDILVVTESEHHASAGAVAESYMGQNPPELELGIISMNRQIFERCRSFREWMGRRKHPGLCSPELSVPGIG